MGASVSMWFYRILSILSVHQKHHVCLQEVCNSRSRKITCLWHRRKHGKNWESSHPALKKNTPKVEDSLLRNGQKQKPQKPCPEDSEIQGVQSLRCQIVPSKGPWAARIFEGPGWSCKASSDWLFFISFPPKASHINAVNALVYHCFSLFLRWNTVSFPLTPAELSQRHKWVSNPLLYIVRSPQVCEHARKHSL